MMSLKRIATICSLHLCAISDNNTCSIIAPATGVERNELAQIKKLFKWCNLGLHILNLNLFHSGSDNERMYDFLHAMHKSKFLWSVRGGYGSAKIIPMLDALPLPSLKRILIGYSDITALHIFLMQKWKWVCVYGAVASERLKSVSQKDPKNCDEVIALIKGQKKEFTMHIEPINNVCVKSPIISSATGGNLTLLTSSFNTCWEIAPAGKILILEDTNVQAFNLDRMFTQLLQTGILKGVTAIVIGDLGLKNDLGVAKNFALACAKLSIPVFKTCSFGHGHRNMPVIMNSHATIYKENSKFLFRTCLRSID